MKMNHIEELRGLFNDFMKLSIIDKFYVGLIVIVCIFGLIWAIIGHVYYTCGKKLSKGLFSH